MEKIFKVHKSLATFHNNNSQRESEPYKYKESKDYTSKPTFKYILKELMKKV